MKKILCLLLFIFLLFACGCGEWSKTTGNVSVKDRIPAKADNVMVKEFDEKLAAISGEASAEQAVNSFIDYVDSRINKTVEVNSAQSSSLFISIDAMNNIVKKELDARNIGEMSVSSVNSSAYTPIDIGTITDSINLLGEDAGIKTDDEIVAIVKNVAEESIPNLNPERSNNMTPLQALVVSYTLVSGDDGTAQESSVNIPVEKMNAFIEKISN